MKFRVVWAKDIPELGIKAGDDGEKQLDEYVLLEQKAGHKWFDNIYYTDIEGFLINQDGRLLLDDGCGGHVWVPEGLFKVVEVEE